MEQEEIDGCYGTKCSACKDKPCQASKKTQEEYDTWLESHGVGDPGLDECNNWG